jgi:hypothetical protein
VQADVVTDVDHRGHLGAGRLRPGAYADQEAGAADAAGEDHDPHEPILAYRPSNRPATTLDRTED